MSWGGVAMFLLPFHPPLPPIGCPFPGPSSQNSACQGKCGSFVKLSVLLRPAQAPRGVSTRPAGVQCMGTGSPLPGDGMPDRVTGPDGQCAGAPSPSPSSPGAQTSSWWERKSVTQGTEESATPSQPGQHGQRPLQNTGIKAGDRTIWGGQAAAP